MTIITKKNLVAAGIFSALDCTATRIGRIVAGSGVRVHDGNGKPLDLPQRGWQHFAP